MEISITNHGIHGFSNSFQHIKNLKNPANWLAKYIFAYNLKKRFEEIFLAESQRQLWCIIKHPKKHTLMDLFFFSKSILLIHTNNPFQRYWQFVVFEHYEHGRPPPRKKWSNCSFHGYIATYKAFLPQIVFEILKFKKLSNPIGLEYFQLQLKN